MQFGTDRHKIDIIMILETYLLILLSILQNNLLENVFLINSNVGFKAFLNIKIEEK